MTFFEVAGRQRACRSFSDALVTDDSVAAVLDAATKAPSSENLQPWVFVVVRDADQRRLIGDHLRTAWEAGGVDYSRGRLPPALLADVDHGQRHGIAAAPVLIVVGGDLTRVPKPWLPSSVFPAVQNLLLAAGALGLGSALTTLATVDRAAMASLVGLPDHIVPLALVPLGHPARPLGPPRREPFSAHTSRERWGEPW